ncbi:sugar ABC transporter substrate-binding protein [Evansella tamaricis]|uniref:Extracellular solute-binding protein n=1 Tax=Evansella tamaricis TaxID=2069301 RepID=A0ABS6JEG9_9BACI|nr:extracellular solute-binding protein [Evansella tamaricis]MBU9710855.1 extracellular solute-binding protein [Evansella tamaricis]
MLKLKTKSLFFLLFLLALSFIFVACNGDGEDAATDTDTTVDTTDEDTEETGDGNDSTSEDTASDIPEKPDMLKMWVHDEDIQFQAYEELTALFTEEFGIGVEMIPYSQSDQLDGLSLDGPQGLGPDLFYTPHDHMGNIHVQGLAAELELTPDQEARLAEYNQEAVLSFSFEGTQYGIPAVVETYVLFYNQDLVPEAPETMDELMDIAVNLTDGDTYGFLIDGTNFYFTYPFLTGPGGYIFHQDADGIFDTDDIGLATAGAVEGAGLIQSWFQDGLLPVGMDMDILNGLFMDGKAGMAVTGPWAIADYREAIGDSLAIAPLPTWDGNSLNSFSGNKGWLVNYYSENLYWATELALFLTNAENGERYFEIANELPAHSNVTINDEFMGPVLEQIQVAEPMPNVPEMALVWEPMADALNFISQGDDPQEVLDEAVEQIRANINMQQ